MKISDHAAELIIRLYRQISFAEELELKEELSQLIQMLTFPGKLKENLNEAINQDQNKLFEHRIDSMIAQSEQFTRSAPTIDTQAFELFIKTLTSIDKELNELKNEINKGI